MNLSTTVRLTDADIRSAIINYIAAQHSTIKVERDKIILRIHPLQRGPDSYTAEIKVTLPK